MNEVHRVTVVVAQIMGVAERLKHFATYLDGEIDRDALVTTVHTRQHVAKVDTSDELHRDEQAAVEFTEFERARDVRMAEQRCHSCLVVEHLHVVRLVV